MRDMKITVVLIKKILKMLPLVLSIATLIINLYTSFHLENFRLIEKDFVSFTKYMEAMSLIKFQLNLSI